MELNQISAFLSNKFQDESLFHCWRTNRWAWNCQATHGHGKRTILTSSHWWSSSRFVTKGYVIPWMAWGYSSISYAYYTRNSQFSVISGRCQKIPETASKACWIADNTLTSARSRFGPLIGNATVLWVIVDVNRRALNVLLMSGPPPPPPLYYYYFEAEGFGIPCTAWAGSGLLVKSCLIRIRADEGARERTRTLKIELVLAAAGVTFP